MFSKTAALLSCLAIATSGFSVRPSTNNAVKDARQQLAKPLRCWEPVEEGVNGSPATGGYTLSEPIYEMCSYMPYPMDYQQFYVNGVRFQSADDYANILAMFQTSHAGHSVLNVCIQEGLQLYPAGYPSQVSMRCHCKRDGCNLPKPFTVFLDFNKQSMPETLF